MLNQLEEQVVQEASSRNGEVLASALQYKVYTPCELEQMPIGTKFTHMKYGACEIVDYHGFFMCFFMARGAQMLWSFDSEVFMLPMKLESK